MLPGMGTARNWRNIAAEKLFLAYFGRKSTR
jgi:hypothetical protein